VVLVAMPAFASVQNVKVSGEIDSTYVSRQQFDLGANTGDNAGTNDQSFFMTQTFLRVDADLTDKVSTTIRILNERPWDVETSSTSDVDLNLAYVTIKEMLYSPLTVIVGRQAFSYGNGLVIDTNGNGGITNGVSNGNRTTPAGALVNVAEDLSKRRALDAVRAILDYNPLTIDLVYGKLDANNLLGIQDGDSGSNMGTKDDVDLIGTNVNYKLGDKYDTVLEGYFWARVDNSGNEGASNNKVDVIYMPGVRAALNVLDGLMLGAEAAWQRGTDSTTDQAYSKKREAMAYQLMANYALPMESTKAYSPVLTTALTYLSGDKGGSGTDTVNKAWDPMLENMSSGKIYNTLFNLSNAYIATLKGSIKPIEDVVASAEWNGLWLAEQLTSTTLPLYQPDDASSGINTTANIDNTKLGDEIDLGLSYAYTEDVTIGATLGWWKPGDVMNSVNRKVATQAMVNLDVKF